MLSAASKLGGGKAQPALQLVGYEAEVEAAIKYAFGSAFVCQVSGGGGVQKGVYVVRFSVSSSQDTSSLHSC